MSSLFSDFINNRLEHVPTGGPVNGVYDFNLSDNESEHDIDSSSDTEQQEYVRKELQSYSTLAARNAGILTDIEDCYEESLVGSDIHAVAVPGVFTKYKFDTYYKKELPIDYYKDKILSVINTNSVVIIHGPTGCGKTTQVPQYILDQCKANNAPCNIVVTQPRRIAAINISQRVCEERGWAMGTVCGYQVGLDKNVGEDVILTYVTTEILLQKLILEKNLNKYTHIIIDEVHERNKNLDFLLLIVRKYLFTNSSGVKIILMSATMEAKEFSFYFRSIPRNVDSQYILAPVVHVTRKSEYTTNFFYNDNFISKELHTFLKGAALPKYNVDEPGITAEQYQLCLFLMSVFDKLDKLDGSQEVSEGEEDEQRTIGSVLVFLPGFHEIEEMDKLLGTKKSNYVVWEIIPLHSHLTGEHMFKAFQKPKPGVRKIILSTNIAESSVTVPDVTYVIDFCLTKVMTVNPLTKFGTLSLEWASHNNCIQRAGRVGRVSNGRVYRLVPYDFYKNHMQAITIPEMQRAPLENIILYIKLLDLTDTPRNVLSLAISPPNLKDVETCIWHLKEVGALLQTCRGHKSASDGDITFMGRIMGSLPIDIHLAKLIILGHMFSCLEETVIMAAGCMTRNLFVNSFHERLQCYRKRLLWADGSSSDFITLINLHKVWLQQKREHAFRSTNEELAWCRTNFVNLKGLREWDILIKEINKRLKTFQIEASVGLDKVSLSDVEKPIILKVIICGAFYPNYYVRSSEYGKVDAREAVKVLNGRDPLNTVYLTNMKPNQPGHIYVRQFKKLMNSDKVQIGFDNQSSKVYVEYKVTREPELVRVKGQQYLATISGTVATEVMEAVRRRQLRIPMLLDILPDHKAWDYAEKTGSATSQQKVIPSEEEYNCYSAVHYSPLPTLDVEYVTVNVTHIFDVGHFYCQNDNDETKDLLHRIYLSLNGPGVLLQPLEDKVQIDSKLYAARFDEDQRFYRCKVMDVHGASPPRARVLFVDYGNMQHVHVNRLHELPSSEECHVHPIAFGCVLSGVQPSLLMNPKGTWCDRAIDQFRNNTGNVVLNAKVYSVVDNVVHMELYRPGTSQSFNEWLIQVKLGEKSEESYMSKMDHENRVQVLKSENPINHANKLLSGMTLRNYTDFEPPATSEFVDRIELKGPFSPLEMKVCGLIAASRSVHVHIDQESVNTVLLDDSPDDPYTRLLVAGSVGQSATSNNLMLSQTTIMPNIKGLPMLLTLLFCPQMEPKVTDDGSRVASVLCGLGHKEHLINQSLYPMHDISLVLDTELTPDIIVKINELRYCMSRSIKAMNNIYDEIIYGDDLVELQKSLKDSMFDLLHMPQTPVNRVQVKYAESWNQSVCNLEVMKIDIGEEIDNIWPLLPFVRLKNANEAFKRPINNNLEELMQISKNLIPEKEIICELCASAPMYSKSDVRIHLFKDEHKIKLAQFAEN